MTAIIIFGFRLLTNNENAESINSQEEINDEFDETANSHDTNTSQNLVPHSPSVNSGTEPVLKKRKKDCSSDILKAISQSAAERENLMKQLAIVPSTPPEDEIDALFKSFAMTVKSFPPLLRLETKNQIYQIISAAELQLVRPEPPPSQISSYSYESISTPMPSPNVWQQDAPSQPSTSDTSQYFGNFRP